MSDPTEVPVVRATSADAAVVGRLLWDFNEEFSFDGPGADEFAGRFASLLDGDDVVVLLTGSRDDPSGFAFLTLRPTPYYDGPLAQLEELYVKPHLRDRGLGTALLRAAVDLVRSRRGGEIHINVDEVDADTRRFYERNGFTNIQPGEDYRMLCYLREL
ncbi:GNAT family N-acetyltransferase [Promicromonospora soli]